MDALGILVPRFGSCMRELLEVRLKYQAVTERVRRLLPANLRQQLVQDKQLEMLGISRDLML